VNARRLAIAVAMTLRQLLRSRIVLLLLFIVPTLFYAIIILTTTDEAIAFQLGSLPANSAGQPVVVQVGKQPEALVFIGLAAVGLLTAFLAMNLVQRQLGATRRLVLCGYRPTELVTAKLVVLVAVIVAISAYVVAALPLFFDPRHMLGVALGFALIGWVYGCYGLLVGALFRRNLEGILFVVLLANIDAGWLQNPIFYADADNQAIIEALPAFFPAQVSMIAAFTDHAVARPAIAALLYGAALLVLALVVFGLRVRRG